MACMIRIMRSLCVTLLCQLGLLAVSLVVASNTTEHSRATQTAYNMSCGLEMFEMQGNMARNGNNASVYCMCPARYKCTHCSRMCRNSRFRLNEDRDDMPPTRCVQGVHRHQRLNFGSHCTPPKSFSKQSVLRPTINTSVGIRVIPYRCGLGAGSIHAPEINGTFVFTISNGHAGTKFLGSRETWKRYLPVGVEFPDTILPEFERFPQNLAVQQIGLHMNYCSLGRLYLKSIWWPKKDVSNVLGAKSSQIRTWFDSGHLASFLLGQLVDVLGPHRLGFVRLRRNRIDLAYSKMVSVRAEGLQEIEDDFGFGPCAQSCVWCFCPLDAATVCLPPGSVWSKMTPFMRFLWEVDELECLWRLVLQNAPSLRTLEVNWSDKISATHLEAIANFLGIPFATSANRDESTNTSARNTHVTNSHRAAKNMSDLRLQDQAYQQLLRPVRCDEYACTWW